MNNDYFLRLVKENVAKQYVNESTGMNVSPDDVYIVWFCKTLQNWKALASTPIENCPYFEVTYNGDKHELYVDEYHKFKNTCVKVRDN